MEQPKARLTLQQSQQAINEAIWIDASPHEWPTIDKMGLLCSALIDSVQMGDYLRSRLAAVEAERDAARAGEERAVEALWKYRSAQRRMLDKWADGDNAVKTELWRSLHDCEKLADAVLCQAQPALDWLAQQRAEAAAEALEKLATDLRQDPWGTTLHDVDSLRSILRTRAAALRAGGKE